MEIRVDNLDSEEISELLRDHLRDMYSVSPPESVHALDISKLKSPDITFWTVWSDDRLAGCGAIKKLSETEAEIKSMRTATEFRRTGVGARILTHILSQAIHRKYRTVYLETGSMDYFKPAVSLYKRFGFEICGPFKGYKLDPNSIFMRKDLA